MPLPGDLGSFPDLASAWITGLLDAALRGTLLLLIAGLAARLLRDAPAAARHAVWALALAGLLLTPVLQPLMPALEAPFVPEIRLPAGPESATAAAPAAPSSATAAPGPRSGTVAAGGEALPADPVPSEGNPGLVATAAARIASWGAGGVLGLVWLLGFLAVMASLVLGKIRVWWMARDARRIRDGPWTKLRDELAGRLGLDRPVRLLRSPRPLVPMTWGIARPRVLLPAAAEDWPRACRRNVLLHELAHVKRRDLLVRHLARLACAVYWFHPLVWVAARRLRLEQEEACDDHVLRGGALASDYARHLVGLARVLKAVRSTARAGSTGGGRTDFARRMRALLAPSRERGALSSRWLGATVAGAATVIAALAALAPATPADAAAGARPGPGEMTAVAGPDGGPVGMELPSIRVDRPRPADERAAAALPERGGGSGSDRPAAADEADPTGGKGAAGEAAGREEARDGAVAASAGGRDAGPTDPPAPSSEEAAATTEMADASRPPRSIGGAVGGGGPAFEALAPSLVARWQGGPGREATDGAAGAREPRSDAGGRTGSAGVGDEARRLVTRLEAAADPVRRSELLREAARDGDTRTMSVLLEVSFRAARHGDRVQAVRTLAREASRETGGRFLYQVARTNPWPGVRAEAIHQLRRLRPEQVVTWLVHLAYHDEERAVQRRAVGALARLGGGAESSLTQIARSHPDAEVRIAAIYWLVRTGSGSSLAKYVQAA